MAQVCQCLKALHEFSNQGSWRTAWPLTMQIDPLRSHSHGGNEVEMETVLGYLRTQDDLRRRVLSNTQSRQEEDLHHPADEEAEDPDGPARRRRRPKAKAKPKAGAADG